MTDFTAEIRDVVTGVWGTLFAQDLAEAPTTRITEGPLLSSYVGVEGAWQGSVFVEVPLVLAQDLTSQILQQDGAPSPAAVSDAMGEFCNVVAGNFKAFVPGPSQLSLPVVTVGSDFEVNVVGASSSSTVGFTCNGHGFRVIVHEGGDAV